jgi:hypothetical protein
VSIWFDSLEYTPHRVVSTRNVHDIATSEQPDSNSGRGDRGKRARPADVGVSNRGSSETEHSAAVVARTAAR